MRWRYIHVYRYAILVLEIDEEQYITNVQEVHGWKHAYSPNMLISMFTLLTPYPVPICLVYLVCNPADLA